jgi:hypothetical protein
MPGTVRAVRWWKWVGLGAVAAVAVTGAVVVARSRRTYVDADDTEIAERLRARLEQLRAAG